MAAVAAAVRAVRQQVPHACLYIDFPWGELPHALRLLRGEPASEAQRAAAAAEVEALWGGPGALATLSVRTAFHLFLLAKRWPPGSEVIVSAINIPDMSSLLRHHGLRIVPLDVDVLTLAPRVDLVDALVTPHTRALLVAHLFGRRFDVAPLAAAARRLNLTLIEDSAEAFCGAEYRGHPLADISMFSFGTIKTGTSFGGALSRVRDEAVLQAMRRAHEGFPVQPSTQFAKKVARNAAAMAILNVRVSTAAVTLGARALGTDAKPFMVRMMRGFGGGEGGAEALVAAISMRPCAALLALLARRLAAFDASLFARHVRNGDLVVSRLSPRAVVPGERAAARNYWLFPVVVRDPERVLRALNAAGVDAYRGASQLACVEGAERLAPTAHAIMQQVLYLPVQKNMSPADLIAVTDRLNAFLEAAQAPRPRL